ncbi:MAG: ornithine cyclodeaminase family protein [Actinomycetota bacterium]|nr:ornithine cyclodeaminase family protein [Actinomycetota bacterium]
MSAVPYLDASALRSLVTMDAAIDAVERAFVRDDTDVPPRAHLAAGPGELLLMPASAPAGTGVKLVTVNPDNPRAGKPLISGVYVLFDVLSLEPALILDGAALTALRTPAVSAVATKHLSREDARTLVVFGAGTQARGHIEAMRAVRPVESVTVVARSQSSATELAAGVGGRAGSPDDVAGADLVCTCTTSARPLFDGSSLAAGAHVNAVGAYKPHARELDDTTIARASVVVEDRAAALAEAGDLIMPVDSGVLDPATVAELRDLVRGSYRPVPDKDVTVFKSVGLASEDLAVAAAARDALRQTGGSGSY